MELFDGVTYNPALDEDRLTRQLGRVYDALLPGDWLTFADIQERSAKLGFTDSYTGVSARIRDLRKLKHGGHSVASRRRFGGLWEYRLIK
jgi:hypothetical protein